MSGMEVAGVILGVLSLAIKAVKQYMDILSSVKDAKRTLKCLLQDLGTEQVRLETTCEVLLDGIVPHDAIDKLIRTPLGPEWKQYNEKLRLRLWNTTQRFEEQIAEMQTVVEELRTELCIEPDGTTNLVDRFAILRELKRGASFTLKKKDYDEILNKIKTANSVLHDLVNQHRGPETSRKYRSQARLVRLVRNLTRGIFNSLRNASESCRCSGPHDVCLELEPRDVVIVPNDKENDVGEKFRFHVVLAREDLEDLENKGGRNLPFVQWESVDIKISTEYRSPAEISSSPIEPSPKLGRRSRRVGWARSLGFRAEKESVMARTSLSSVSTQTLVKTTQRVPLSSLQSTSAPTGIGLCQLIKSPDESHTECYGYIWDGIDRKFELRPPEGIPITGRRTITTLREILNGRNGNPGLQPFGYPKKLRVALTLAVSVLHLYKTPWLAKIFTLDDVDFLIEQDGTSTYHPFLSRRLKEDVLPSPQPTVSFSPRPVNVTVLALGALLIQIMLGRAVDALDMAKGNEALDMDSVLSKYEAGSRLSGEVLTCGGINFANVVKWCLSAVLEVAGFDNDEFCQKFYGAVVTKLEEDATLLVEMG